MGRLFSTLIDHMSDEGWKFDILEGQTALKFSVRGKSGRMLCFGDVEEDKGLLMFYSYLPVNVTPDKYGPVAEFINRANHGLRIGNFEMDYSDGEIRYKTSIDIEGGELTPKMIENLLNANLSTMDRYFPGFMSVLFGDKDPSEVILSIEQPDDMDDDHD